MPAAESKRPSGSPDSRGVLYYARGRKWLEEAKRSVGSVKAVMPDLMTAIVTDEELPDALFDIHVPAPRKVETKQLKMWSLTHTPFDRTLFLDTDTFVIDPVWEVFDLLDQFDLAAAVTPYWMVPLTGRGGAHMDHDIPVCFPKLNTGVIAFRRTELSMAFVEAWTSLHREWGHGQDQPSFRATLYRNGLRFGVLAPAYNYRLPYPSGILGFVKIFHGREPDMARLAKRVNAYRRWRITSPHKYLRRSITYGDTWFQRRKSKAQRWIRRWLRSGRGDY